MGFEVILMDNEKYQSNEEINEKKRKLLYKCAMGNYKLPQNIKMKFSSSEDIKIELLAGEGYYVI